MGRHNASAPSDNPILSNDIVLKQKPVECNNYINHDAEDVFGGGASSLNEDFTKGFPEKTGFLVWWKGFPIN